MANRENSTRWKSRRSPSGPLDPVRWLHDCPWGRKLNTPDVPPFVLRYLLLVLFYQETRVRVRL